MQQNSKKRLNTRLVFFWGMLFMYLGCAFLLAAFTEASRVSVAVASLFIIVGSFFAFLAVTLHKRAIFLFLATFSILVGFFLFLSSLKIVPIVLGEWWPAISIFAGLALIPTGWYYYGTVKPRYVVTAAIFIILGVVLLFFSLGVVDFSFRHFLTRWWPLLMVITGLILLLISLGTKFLPEETGRTQ